jgi:hypothetical protein
MHLIEMEINPRITFFCPMTGAPVYSKKGFTPSKAMTFAYSPDVGEFEAIQPWAKKIWDQLFAAADDEFSPSDLFEAFMKQLEPEPTLVVFAFSSTGPWAITNYLCFDFDYGSDEYRERARESTHRKKRTTKKKPSVRRK